MTDRNSFKVSTSRKDGSVHVEGPYGEDITILSGDYHRNGISGVGFVTMVFVDHKQDGMKFLATIFGNEDPKAPFYNCETAVVSLDLIEQGGVEFGFNSWRGDHYDRALRVGFDRLYQNEQRRFNRQHGIDRLAERYFTEVPS